MAKVFYKGVGLVEADDLITGKVILPPEAIYAGLSSKIRFAGQASEDYTVDKHSREVGELAAALVAQELGVSDTRLAPPTDRLAIYEAALWGYLHDCPEAIFSDVAAPVKHSNAFRGYRDVEAETALCYLRFYAPSLHEAGRVGLSRYPLVMRMVHRADKIRLAVEAMNLLPLEAVNNIIDSALDDGDRDELFRYLIVKETECETGTKLRMDRIAEFYWCDTIDRLKRNIVETQNEIGK